MRMEYLTTEKSPFAAESYEDEPDACTGNFTIVPAPWRVQLFQRGSFSVAVTLNESTHLVYTNSDRVPGQTRPTYSAWWPVSIFEVLKLRAQLANQPIHSICASSDTQYWVFQK